jgi:hypothetical protein
MERFQNDLDTHKVIGSRIADTDDDMTNASNFTELPLAAALTFDKFLTMQVCTLHLSFLCVTVVRLLNSSAYCMFIILTLWPFFENIHVLG